MAETQRKASSIDAVQHGSRSLATEVAHEVHAKLGPELALSEDDMVEIQRLAYRAIEETLNAVDPDHPGGDDPPPPVPRLSHQVAKEVCQAAVARTWRALIEGSNGPERRRLLHAAANVFNRAQRLYLVEDASAAPQSKHVHKRDAVVRALLHGEPAESEAARCHIKLAPSYVVALLELDPTVTWPRDDRQGILTAEEGGLTLALLPTLLPVQRVELHGFCERALRGATRSATRVAVAPAQSRGRIASAVNEARTVHHVTLTLDFRPGIYQLADIPLEAALTRSPDLANLLAHRLTPLHGSGAPMLQTLRVYLEKGQDRRQAARALHIHPNTLDYRLRRIRELTGLSPTVPHDIQTLCAAIIAWRLTHPGQSVY